jgi:hypothetical protein
VAQARNNFDAGTNGSPVTIAAAEGSPNPWSESISSGSSAITYDGTMAWQGPNSAKIAVDGPGNQSFVAWNASAFPTPLTTYYARAYLWMPPAASGGYFHIGFDAGLNNKTALGSTAQKIRAYDAALALLGEIATPHPTNSWFRVEWKVICGNGTGQFTVNLYKDPVATIPADSISLSGLTIGVNAQYWRFGNSLGSSPGFSFWQDAIELNDYGYPGPYPVSGTPTPAPTSIHGRGAA